MTDERNPQELAEKIWKTCVAACPQGCSNEHGHGLEFDRDKVAKLIAAHTASQLAGAVLDEHKRNCACASYPKPWLGCPRRTELETMPDAARLALEERDRHVEESQMASKQLSTKEICRLLRQAILALNAKRRGIAVELLKQALEELTDEYGLVKL